MGAGQSHEIPKTMRRLTVAEYNSDLSKVKMAVEVVDVPVPRSGQLLVRVCAAPVNPSDYGSWKAAPPSGKEPAGQGKEGSGIVVASGGGPLGQGWLGRKVGICNVSQGTYQEYVCVDVMTGVYQLPADLPVEDAASFFVNPYTAAGFVDTVRSRGATGFVHTAAASQLGQMLVKLCKQEKLTLINVVRRQEQADILTKLGAEHIVDSSVAGWQETLRAKVKELGITVAFDAIAGESSGQLLDILPPKGTVFVYGGLSGEPVKGLHPMDLIYKQKKLEGWFLPTWIKGGGVARMAMLSRWAGQLVLPSLGKGGWAESQFVDCTLDDMWPKFLEMWNGGGFTNKKLRITFPETTAEKAT